MPPDIVRPARRGATILLLAALAAAKVGAQPAAAASAPDFSESSRAASPAARLSEALSGRAYAARLANGQSWHLEFKAGGLMFINVSSGARDSGQWRTEDGKVCIAFRGNFPSGCSDWRLVGSELWLKRSTGEVVQVRPD